jgi:hypothetical protein
MKKRNAEAVILGGERKKESRERIPREKMKIVRAVN